MGLRREWHNATQLHYHIVFPVKYRKALLKPEIVAQICEISKALEERYFFEMERLGCDGDHIHLLSNFSPKYSISSFVRLFKSLTARELFRKFPDLRKDLWGGEFWSDGYYAATIGERGNWKVVEAYVRSQGRPISQLRLLF